MDIKKIFSIVAFAVAIAFVGSIDTQAKPGGIKSVNVGKKLMSFNVIVHPGDWDSNGNSCNGNRIFFNEDGGGSLGTIDWQILTSTTNWSILDCDGTDGDAMVEIPETVAFYVFVRLVGPQNSSLDLTCAEVVDAGPNDDLCLIDEADVKISEDPDVGKWNLNKSKDFTKIMKNLVDNANEHVLWTLDNSTNAKILQVWIYEVGS